MKRTVKDVRRYGEIASFLFLATMVVFGGCSSRGSGPVPVKGIVTGKQLTTLKGNPAEGSEKETSHYFLWVQTEDGLVLVEVDDKAYQGVMEGEQVCINCTAEGP
ncbi:MAG: hypothetical protein V3U14_02575 [candidate division NC10 bacterium]